VGTAGSAAAVPGCRDHRSTSVPEDRAQIKVDDKHRLVTDEHDLPDGARELADRQGAAEEARLEQLARWHDERRDPAAAPAALAFGGRSMWQRLAEAPRELKALALAFDLRLDQRHISAVLSHHTPIG